MNIRTILFLFCTISMVLTQPTLGQSTQDQPRQDQPAQEQPPAPRADVIVLHGNIYTGITVASSFHETKRADAMAIRGDRVQEIGKQSDILKLKGPETQIINVDGHFVMPGFNDAHLHLASAGFQRLTVNLVGVKSLTEFRDRIRARVETAGPGEWIVGSGWDQTLWPVKELPSRWDIDEVSLDHPVFLQRVDGHIAVANTRALQLAAITLASKDPEGGKIDRDLTGGPTGILRETARDAVSAVVPKPTPEKRRQAIEAALQDLAQWGITSAQDNSGWEDFQVYEQLEREGKLTVRISEWLAFDDSLETLKAHRAAHPVSDNMLHTGMLKGFMDGSLGSRTAALLEPYADDPKNSGLPQYEQARLTAMTKERADAGFQIGFHAIGDKGVQMALDAFASTGRVGTGDVGTGDVRTGDVGTGHVGTGDVGTGVSPVQAERSSADSTDHRFRIEHAQVTTPAQIAKFKQLKMIASMQPNHLLTDMNWAMDRLGPKRAATSYAWAEFLKKGVTLAFGTDYPVEPVAPFRGLYAAVTRKSEDGK